LRKAARSQLDRAITLALKGSSDEALVAARARGVPEDWRRWIAAYVASSAGNFRDALGLSAPLASDSNDRTVRVFASLTVGSVLRQMHRYREAVVHDRRAQSEARTASERTHAYIGLAADAIGLAFTTRCGLRLSEAAAVAPAGDWRCEVRLDWVRTEHALATERPARAVICARRALRLAAGVGARRHIAKSHLFLGAALGTAGNRVASHKELQAAVRTARACGAKPIEHIARAMLSSDRVRAAG
jgi:hypothetical protein